MNKKEKLVALGLSLLLLIVSYLFSFIAGNLKFIAYWGMWTGITYFILGIFDLLIPEFDYDFIYRERGGGEK